MAKKVLSIPVIILTGWLSAAYFADTPYTTSGEIVRLSYLASTMGSSDLTLGKDRSLALLENPAYTAHATKSFVALSHHSLPAKIFLEYISFFNPAKRKGVNIGLSFGYLFTVVEGRDGYGEDIGSAMYREMVIGITISKKLPKFISFGGNIKVVNAGIYKYSSWSIMLDPSVMFYIENISLTVGLFNAGYSLSHRSFYNNIVKENNPEDSQFPITLKSQFEVAIGQFSLGAGVSYLFGSPLEFLIGLDWELFKKPAITLRGGYIIRQKDSNLFSAGLGYRLNITGLDVIQVDYTFKRVPSIDNSHHISLSGKF